MTRHIRFVLVTPSGERITQETAKAHGLEWYPYPHRRLLDGISAILRFTRAAPAGRYRIELTALKPGAPVTVIARFHSRVEDYLRMLRSIPNAQTPPAVPLRSSAVIGLGVPKIGEPCAFEVIVPDTSVEVSLALPGGRVLHPGDNDGTKMAWESVDRRGGKNAKDSGLLSVAFQTPIDGMHHVIAFLDSPPPGRYEVRATSRRPQVNCESYLRRWVACFPPSRRSKKTLKDSLPARSEWRPGSYPSLFSITLATSWT